MPTCRAPHDEQNGPVVGCSEPVRSGPSGRLNHSLGFPFGAAIPGRKSDLMDIQFHLRTGRRDDQPVESIATFAPIIGCITAGVDGTVSGRLNRDRAGRFCVSIRPHLQSWSASHLNSRCCPFQVRTSVGATYKSVDPQVAVAQFLSCVRGRSATNPWVEPAGDSP